MTSTDDTGHKGQFVEDLSAGGRRMPGLTSEGRPLPVIPFSHKEAKARGLKTYAGAECRLDGTRMRTVLGNHCVACREREKAQQRDRDRAVQEKERARVLEKARAMVLRELEREERQSQKDAEKARQDAKKAAARAQREAAKLEREKERRKQKAAETRARNKAAREEAAAAAPPPAPPEAPPVVSAPAWAEFAG